MHGSYRAAPNKHVGLASVPWCTITAILTHWDVMQRLSSYWSHSFIVRNTWKHKAFPLQIPRSFRSSWFKAAAQCPYATFHTHLPDMYAIRQGLQASSSRKVTSILWAWLRYLLQEPVTLLQRRWGTVHENSLKSGSRYILSPLASKYPVNFNCYGIITNLKKEWKITLMWLAHYLN